jgi:hypothetical protein
MHSTWFFVNLTGGLASSHLRGTRSAGMENESLEIRQLRLARNQSLFRSVNERVEKVVGSHVAPGPIAFVCECAQPDCASMIELGRNEYEAIRAHPARFFVLAGHVFPEVEKVVEDRPQFVVVEKIGIGGRVAKALHDRPSAG